MIRFALSADSALIITDSVERHLLKHRQLKCWSREAGGQLFATFDGPDVTIREATGPRRSDLRGRTYYQPDRGAENVEIAVMYDRGLHFIGDWHTHPEEIPQPSGLDMQSIGDCVRLSHHQLAGFLLIVVGRSEWPRGIYVSLHGRDVKRQLTPFNTEVLTG